MSTIAKFDIDNSASDEIVLTEIHSLHIFRFIKTKDGKRIDLSSPEAIEPNLNARHGHEFYRIAAVQAARQALAAT